MKDWLFPYGAWYLIAVACAAGAAGAVARGDVSGATLDGALAVAVGVTALRSRVRWSRSGEKALRAELVRLVDERAGSGAAAWLHRDSHLLFDADRRRVAGMREWSLLVLDEEQLRDVDDARDAGGGKVAVTCVSYRAHPVLSRVMRQANGTTALVTAADIEQADPDERRPWWREFTGMIRTIRAGLAFADASDLAEVVAQFRDAEPVSRDRA